MKVSIHRQAFFAAALLAALLLPTAVLAANFHLDSGTMFRFFQRDLPDGSSANVAPAYEYLQFDLGSRETKGLSFHFYTWGRADLADSGFYSDSTSGEVLYGYLQYTRDVNNLDVRLGRQYIFAGVGDQSIDGLRVSGDVSPYFSVSAYGGLPVALDTTSGRSGDSTFGGRVSNHYKSLYDLGVSYKKVQNDGDLAEEKMGVDLSLALPEGISVYGLSTLNLDSGGWAEHSYEVRFHLKDVQFRPFFQRYNYDDYFRTTAESANPFRFLAGTNETLTVYGSDATWRSDPWEAGLKFKYYNYDKRADSSQYYGGLLSWHGENLTSIGGEVGYMDGNTDPTKYLLLRGYGYWDKVPAVLLVDFLTGDVVYVDYQNKINNQGYSFFASLGAGKKFFANALQIKLSGDYSKDPYFDNDLRGMLVAKFVFDR